MNLQSDIMLMMDAPIRMMKLTDRFSPRTRTRRSYGAAQTMGLAAKPLQQVAMILPMQ